MRIKHALVVIAAAACAMASMAQAAGLWSPAELVGPDDRPDSIFPNVEVSPEGTVWIVWSSEDPAEEDTEVSYVTVTDFVQSPAQRIHENNQAMDRCPLMSMGSDGVPWVVWERYGHGYEQVVSHWTGESWSPPETVLIWGSRWDEYTIHASSSDDVWVARSSVVAGRDDRDIFLRHWDGTSWGEIEQVGLSGEDDRHPELVTDW